MNLHDAALRVLQQLGSSTDPLTAGCMAELRAALVTEAERKQRDVAMHDALCEAVKYVLDRSQTDPDLGYYLGPGMQAFYLLCQAEAAALGKPLADVEKARRRNLRPDREPEVLELRKRVEELQQ